MTASGTKTECVIVMPAYNEQDCISEVLNAWLKELRIRFGASFRIVVVDDGSRDRTGVILDDLAKTASELLVIRQKNAGHGAALMTGYRQALTLSPDYVFQVDSDDQFEPADFQKLWNERNDSKFILGFRSERHDPFHRLVITKVLRLMVFMTFGIRGKDLNIPFRLIRTDYLKALLEVLPAGLFAPNIFLSILAAADGQDLKCIPVTHRDRQSGSTSIVRWKLIKVCLRTAKELIKFRLSMNSAIRKLKSLE
jgi:glycosyltransferase involved in cell wall biosynthesis